MIEALSSLSARSESGAMREPIRITCALESLGRLKRHFLLLLHPASLIFRNALGCYLTRQRNEETSLPLTFLLYAHRINLHNFLEMVRLAVAPARWTHRTTPIRGRAPRVLVVDDNQSGADALATYLELVSMSVQAAYDGTSAIALVKIWRPDVVLLDISMPGLDGFDVVKLLRADVQVSSVIIVALTAHDEAHVRARATPAEFDAYCQKGLVLDPLMRLLEELTRDEAHDPTSAIELPILLPGSGYLPS